MVSWPGMSPAFITCWIIGPPTHTEDDCCASRAPSQSIIVFAFVFVFVFAVVFCFCFCFASPPVCCAQFFVFVIRPCFLSPPHMLIVNSFFPTDRMEAPDRLIVVANRMIHSSRVNFYLYFCFCFSYPPVCCTMCYFFHSSLFSFCACLTCWLFFITDQMATPTGWSLLSPQRLIVARAWDGKHGVGALGHQDATAWTQRHYKLQHRFIVASPSGNNFVFMFRIYFLLLFAQVDCSSSFCTGWLFLFYRLRIHCFSSASQVDCFYFLLLQLIVPAIVFLLRQAALQVTCCFILSHRLILLSFLLRCTSRHTEFLFFSLQVDCLPSIATMQPLALHR